MYEIIFLFHNMLCFLYCLVKSWFENLIDKYTDNLIEFVWVLSYSDKCKFLYSILAFDLPISFANSLSGASFIFFMLL